MVDGLLTNSVSMVDVIFEANMDIWRAHYAVEGSFTKSGDNTENTTASQVPRNQSIHNMYLFTPECK